MPCFVKLRDFYCVIACNAMHGIALAILSVHPFVCLSDACIVTKQNNICQYLNTLRNRDISSLCTPTGVAENCPLSPEMFAKSDPPPFEKRRLQQISAYNVSTLRDGKKVQSSQIGNRPQAFQQAMDGVRTLPLIPQRVAQKPIFQFFGIKFNFSRIKSATKFLCVKTSINKVVQHSVSYEIAEKYRMESVSFHLKYWLKLTYTPLLHSTCMLITMAHSADE